MLYMIGLGLCDEKDITIKGLEAIRNSDVIFLEYYTSVLINRFLKKESLEEFYKKKVILADRTIVEQESEKIIQPAKKKNVAFLVVGDVFGATTHTDLFLRAKKEGVDVKIINNASILNAVGIVGLELYKYGYITSVVFETNNWHPETHYDVLKSNLNNNLHTLALLDIKISEPSPENILKGINKPEPPRFMTINEAIKSFLRIELKRKENVFTEETLCIGVARLGCNNQLIISGKAKELLNIDFGKPLHSLIIPSKKLHPIEEEMLNFWKIKVEKN